MPELTEAQRYKAGQDLMERQCSDFSQAIKPCQTYLTGGHKCHPFAEPSQSQVCLFSAG